jgi:hypothetical protein
MTAMHFAAKLYFASIMTKMGTDQLENTPYVSMMQSNTFDQEVTANDLFLL